jgi:RNA 3'-terminal phosphate cyclase (ATP)
VSEAPVLVDGSWGEGGGQILRTSLTLSLVTGRPVFIHNIRAGRSEPGLRPQHLVAVEAARAVTSGRAEGATIGSTSLRFFPRPGEPAVPQPPAAAFTEPATPPGPAGPSVEPGDYRFRIATAGATTLVLQTLVPALALAAGDSTITVSGGTHVAWAPTFDYLARHWVVMLARLGLEVDARLEQAGFYPRGGGSVRVRVPGCPAGRPPEEGGPAGRPMRARGADRVKPLEALERAAGVSLVSGLPRHIAERQAQELERGLRQLGLQDAHDEVAVELVEPRSVSPGTAVYVEAVFATGRAAFTALGQRGKTAEHVAREALNELARYLKTDAALDYHLADQLLLPLALASGESRFTTNAVSEHLLTNAHVISLFLGPVVEVRGKVGEPGEVRVTPGGS